MIDVVKLRCALQRECARGVAIQRFIEQGDGGDAAVEVRRVIIHAVGRVDAAGVDGFIELALWRDYAAAQTIEVGMADMSENFRARGGEIYLRKEEA